MKKILFFMLLFVLGSAVTLVIRQQQDRTAVTISSQIEKSDLFPSQENFDGTKFNSEMLNRVLRENGRHLDLNGSSNSFVSEMITEEMLFPQKVSDTKIAKLIEASLPLNPWLKNQDSIYYDKDTIMWNYVAMGFGKINPRYEVTYGQSMWSIATEIIRNNSYLNQQSKKKPTRVYLSLKEFGDSIMMADAKEAEPFIKKDSVLSQDEKYPENSNHMVMFIITCVGTILVLLYVFFKKAIITIVKHLKALL